MLTKKKYAVYGNCQAPVIARILNSAEQFSSIYACVDIPGMHEMTLEELIHFKSEISEISLFIYQNVQRGDYATSTLLPLLNKDCIKISIPSLFFNGYNPEVAYLRQSRSTLFYHDRIMLNHISDMNKFMNILKSDDYFPEKFSKDCIEASIDELSNREKMQELHIKISDFIKHNYRFQRLFHVLNHPSSVLIEELSNRILMHLGIKPQKYKNIFLGPLDKWQFPIYKSHYNNLKLEFNNEMKYIWAGKIFNLNDFFEFRRDQYNTLDLDFAKKDIFAFKKPIIRGWDLAAELEF